jgi:hypothetical protein
MGIANLCVLGVFSKQVRREARTLFWARLDFTLLNFDSTKHEALHSFLTTMDPDARVSIPKLRFRPCYNPHPTLNGHDTFQRILPTLALNQNLRPIQLRISDVFRDDIDILRQYFSGANAVGSNLGRRAPLVSSGLKRLANTIFSLRLLTAVCLNFEPGIDLYNQSNIETGRFLRFASSG